MSLLKFLWHGMGKPGAWLVLMIVVVANEIIASTTHGTFWFALYLLIFHLAIIAERLDKILEKLPTKEE